MNTTNNSEPTTVTIVIFNEVPEYRSPAFQREYDAYLAQIKRDEYAYGPFSEAAQ